MCSRSVVPEEGPAAIVIGAFAHGAVRTELFIHELIVPINLLKSTCNTAISRYNVWDVLNV